MTRVTAHPETFELICRTCREAKVRERFERYPSGNYRDTCRACVNATKREQRTAYMRSWRETNREYVRRAARDRYQRDHARIIAQRRDHYHRTKEQLRESQAAYRERHRDELREYQSEYRRLRLSTTLDDSGDDASST